MLEMYIDNLLIDKAEPNFLFADTLRKRDEVIEDLKSYLYKQNFDKAFISRKEPLFALIAESKVNEIISDEINEETVMQELVDEWDSVVLAYIAYHKLNKWSKL